MRNGPERDQTTENWQSAIRPDKVQPGEIYYRVNYVDPVFEERNQRQREPVGKAVVFSAVFG